MLVPRLLGQLITDLLKVRGVAYACLPTARDGQVRQAMGRITPILYRYAMDWGMR